MALREDITSLAKKREKEITKKTALTGKHKTKCCFEMVQEAEGFCDQVSADLENITAI